MCVSPYYCGDFCRVFSCAEMLIGARTTFTASIRGAKIWTCNLFGLTESVLSRA